VADNRELTEVISAYNGWIVRSGFHDGQLFGVLSGFSRLLLIVGAGTIILGIVWIVYITRRSSKPIESLVSRLVKFAEPGNRLPEADRKSHELYIIESAMTDLMERSQYYESRHKEDFIYRRRHLFREIVYGQNRWNDAEVRAHLEQLSLPADYGHICPVVMEIDKYTVFEEKYSLKDQHLLKFAMRCVVKELSEELHFPVWEEWVSERRLGVLYMLPGSPEEMREPVTKVSDRLNHWVRENLPFTITVAVGPAVSGHDQMPEAFAETDGILGYKSVMGLTGSSGTGKCDGNTKMAM
jgi:hypothetical protein